MKFAGGKRGVKNDFKSPPLIHLLRLVIIFDFILVAACTISLVPHYDPSIVNGLNEANEQTLTLFSSVAAGSPKGKFPELSNRYDEAIGKFDALRLQAMARAVPPLAKRISDQLSKFRIVQDICRQEGGDPDACVNSSPRTINTIVDNLSKMRDTHRDKGLEFDTVELFRNAHETSIQAVLIVETALKRD